MIIPSKLSGYSKDGCRTYPSGGGSSGDSYTNANRPQPGSGQFIQPIYQQQYQNYTTTNPLGVSQYGQPMTAQSLVDSAYAGIGRYGSGSGLNQVDPGGRQYWTNQLSSGAVSPSNFFEGFNADVRNFQNANPTDPYSIYTQQSPGYQGGFTGFSSSPNPYAMQMQTPFNPYAQQTPFSYGGMGGYGGNYGNMGGYSGMGDYSGMGGYSGAYGGMSSTPQTPMAQSATRSSGPSQPIVSRSAGMRSTPNVMMRRAEGGIASLVDDE